ncbi:sulfatase-like hydrolase/transferase [Methylocaldum sp.]|uniref:sulfatase-like hydrolase/transferase n=1 Tax=Methylocaldum sp. TaxID=1969727 RepID=UPI002D70E8FF|nr:sulfatase-like hydrolase/transferase [Methylocaldum sp.]HYE37069.1 sulfatase-like hydrolase/transferase [Methylocaldum sp.]
MAEMRFSIIATVRNEAASIRDFVDSLLNQSRVPDEIVIVDGASTDGTREILEDYAARGWLRVISRPCNIAEGRNLGISAATGTHLAVTDAGCRVDPDWLANIAQCFEAIPRPDVVAGNFRFETHTPFEEAVVLATFQPNRDETLAARYFPSSRSVAFTKVAWEKAGGYPEWLYAAEDTLFNIRMRQLGFRFAFCRDAIVRWRPRESWRALARQRINFSRGNARVGIGTSGYLINLRIHGAIAALLVSGFWFLPTIAVALALFGWHIHKHLWPQVLRTTSPDDWRMRLRVLAVMEFVRIVNVHGFLRGRWDRITDPTYVEQQIQYMDVASVDDLDLSNPPGRYRKKRLDLPPDRDFLFGVALAIFTVSCGLIACFVSGYSHGPELLPAVAVAAVGTAALLAKSLLDFSQTGPRIPEEVLTHYRRYTLFALARLSGWAFALMLFTGSAGVLLYAMLNISLSGEWSNVFAAVAATLGILAAVTLQFIRKLRFNPGLLVASMHYRMSRFYRLWRWITPGRIYFIQSAGGAVAALLLTVATWQLAKQNQIIEILALWAAMLFYAGTIAWVAWMPEARPPRSSTARAADAPPNILMIGSDTLRADRLSALGYHRALTPHIDQLAKQGTLFANCYVPCARTAPSLISLMTGTWPHTHGIRDNFVADEDTRLKVNALPNLLKAQDYRTAAISDWCGADMGKFSFGFDYTDLPEDQWNLKYLIRQGPKDLRLFLSLFTHNRLGRLLLPEIYYLGGVPLTQPMGCRARRLVSRLAESAQPFFLNVFYSTTHPPFASEWPWYTRFADPAYSGESKFAMARLTDPFDIIRRQGAPKEEFDLDQIIDLYDGCVAEFDDEVGKMLRHVDACGLAGNTIVVVYSDHGMEFFEHETWGQGNSAVGDFSPRIPLLVHDPRRIGGGVVDRVVRSIDLAPTLMQLVGVPSPSTMDGVPLADCLDQTKHCLDIVAFNETGIWIADIPGLPERHVRYPDLFELLEVPNRATGTLAIKLQYQNITLIAKDRMLRSGRWKLVYQPLTEGYLLQLFDLETDPDCRRNLAANETVIAAQLWAQLEAWMSQDLVGGFFRDRRKSVG